MCFNGSFKDVDNRLTSRDTSTCKKTAKNVGMCGLTGGKPRPCVSMAASKMYIVDKHIRIPAL